MLTRASRSWLGRTRLNGTRMPAPARTTCEATTGWSCLIGARTSGTPCASASFTVFMPPWLTTASSRGSSASIGTEGTTATLSGGSGSRSGGPTMIACTVSRNGATAAAARW